MHLICPKEYPEILELDDKTVVNEEFCVEHGVCIDICPALAIELK
jgi:Pyruvate/2-oxoacid:ferredoxin oxidoreductase delta subunit